jgi:hypothetical protein
VAPSMDGHPAGSSEATDASGTAKTPPSERGQTTIDAVASRRGVAAADAYRDPREHGEANHDSRRRS